MDEEFKNTIAESLSLDLEKITEDATFDSLGLDSLDVVEVSMSLEDKYKVTFPNDYKADNLKQLWDYVQKNKGTKP